MIEQQGWSILLFAAENDRGTATKGSFESEHASACGPRFVPNLSVLCPRCIKLCGSNRPVAAASREVTCKHPVARDEIAYVGKSGTGPLNADNDPSSASIGIYKYDETNNPVFQRAVEGAI